MGKEMQKNYYKAGRHNEKIVCGISGNVAFSDYGLQWWW
jgi:hypothetical protein